MLLLFTLSKEYVNAEASDISYIRTLDTLLLRVRELGSIDTIFVFGLGALMFNYLLFQSNLIPRWILVWGLIANAELADTQCGKNNRNWRDTNE